MVAFRWPLNTTRASSAPTTASSRIKTTDDATNNTANDCMRRLRSFELLVRIPDPDAEGLPPGVAAIGGVLGFVVAVRAAAAAEGEIMMMSSSVDSGIGGGAALAASFSSAMSHFENTCAKRGRATQFYSHTTSHGTFAVQRGRAVLVGLFDGGVAVQALPRKADAILLALQPLFSGVSWA